MFKHLSTDEIFKKSIKIFAKAQKNSPFYRQKYSKIKNLNSWAEIPFLTRDELYKNTFPKTHDMLTSKPKGVLITSTGGSSGMARYGVVSYDEWKKFTDIQAESLKMIGVESTDMVANLFVAGNLWPSFFALQDVIKKTGASHLPISANIEVKKILDYVVEFKPTVLLSLPTVFVFLADLVLEHKLDMSFVKIIAYAGEHMSDMIKSHLQKAFKNAKIYSLGYTSADCGLMGYQCSKCSPTHYHIPTDFQLIEIYDFEKNRLCQSGESGEIVVTNLARFSQPIIRYRIGDMGKILPTTCSCGDENMVLSLEGRAGEDFKIGGAYISMNSVENALKDFVSSDGISANYLFILDDVDENRMDVILRVESSDIKKSKPLANSIKEALKKEIDELKVGEELNYITTKVEFVEIGELPRSPITGKIKHLSDLRVQRSIK